MAVYKLNGKEVTEEEFNKQIFKSVKESPFFLDEIITGFSYFYGENKDEAEIIKQIKERENFAKALSQNQFKEHIIALAQKEELEKVKSACLNTKQYLGIEDVTKIITAESEEELEDILKRNMNIGAPDYKISQENAYDFKLPFSGAISSTGGTVFEKVQNTTIPTHTHIMEEISKEHYKNLENIWSDNFNRDKFTVDNFGKKESKTVEKAPIFTYCKQMKNAVEALALRSLYGHKKYEKGDDWENFSRVENGEFEYSNAEFRHALGIGLDEDEEQHLVASAWNSIARLELYLRNKK